MSVEHMLPDTSIARMIVAWLAGHAEHDDGPAERRRPAPRSPRRAARTGRWRRSRERRGTAARISDRLE